MTKKPVILFLLGILFLTSKIHSQDPNFYIFLCIGQSNMEGAARPEEQDKTVDSSFMVLESVDCPDLGRTKGNWYPAIPPLCRCKTGLSPADYFGRTLVAALPENVRVGVVHVAVAGCKIELFDSDSLKSYSSRAPTWMTRIIEEYGGDPYARLIEMAKLAQKEGVIKGILLHQGESNASDTAWPSKVKKVYNNILRDLNLKPGSVPLLAGEVVNADQHGVSAGANKIIANLPKVLPNSFIISSAGCTAGRDNLHFNAAGYRKLGTRYGVKMLSLLGY
jgi:hypothetical protein